MKKILILRPHLGIPFKKSAYSTNDESNLPPIRQHWKNFLDHLQESLSENHKVKVITGPLWSFSPDILKYEKDVDVIFIPHKIKEQFPVDIDARYYMQSVFPHLFTIDPIGWGSRSNYYSDMYSQWENIDYSCRGFDELSKRVSQKVSKFEQPNRILDEKTYQNYLLFLCQIPHDESIRYHSEVLVESALTKTCEFYLKNPTFAPHLVVKGHPINKASMTVLFDIVKYYSKKNSNIVYGDDIEIHNTISRAKSVITVNSGAGFESLLHKKPVVTFGKTEYNPAANDAAEKELEDLIINGNFPYCQTKVNKVCNYFLDIAYDSNDLKSFNKIKI